MEVKRIFFDGERRGLLETATMETGLQHFKEKFSLGNFRVDLQPGFTFFALGQILTIRGNPDNLQWISLDLRINAQSDYNG
jgi:hypothetical protein